MEHINELKHLLWILITYVLKSNRSGVVTALPRFARPGRDWIHYESLASAVRPVSHYSGIVTALPRFTRPGRDCIHPESLASNKVWQAQLDLASADDLASANLKSNHSGVVTALPCFARPGRDWIHLESLASEEIWQVLPDLASANLKSSMACCVLL